MRRNKISSLSLIWMLLFASNALLAHHGSSVSYDLDKTISVKGMVTEWAFSYPHPQVYFDVKDVNGNVQHWGAEILPSPLQMRNFHFGWSKDSIKPGDQIDLTCNPSKAGTNACLAKKMVINGREMKLTNDPETTSNGKQ